MIATTATTVGSTQSRRFWFGIDAAVTGVNAVGYLALAAPLSEHLGGDERTYRLVGLGLVLFGLGVAAYSASDGARTGTPEGLRIGNLIAGLNAVWVIASLSVAITGLGDFDSLGRLWITAQAIVVAGLTVMQRTTLRP